jgi:hypothetical protein
MCATAGGRRRDVCLPHLEFPQHSKQLRNAYFGGSGFRLARFPARIRFSFHPLLLLGGPEK